MTIEIGARPLTLPALRRIARDFESIGLAPSCVPQIAASAVAVGRILARGAPAYGIAAAHAPEVRAPPSIERSDATSFASTREERHMVRCPTAGIATCAAPRRRADCGGETKLSWVL